MGDTHLEQSEKMVMSIVSSLAEKGVRRVTLTVLDLDIEATSENVDLFVDAIKWLSCEGIIRSTERYEFYSDTESNTVASGFTLTSFGFALLKQPFEGDLTLGAAIKRAQNAGSGYSSVGDLVGGILGGFTKSISS